MTKRSIPLVFLLSFFTCGLYPLYWLVKTKDEMNKFGAGIPTAWLILIPVVDLYWLWKWCCGIGLVTERNRRNLQMPPVMALLLHIVFPLFSIAAFQIALNEAADHLVEPAQLPTARVV